MPFGILGVHDSLSSGAFLTFVNTTPHETLGRFLGHFEPLLGLRGSCIRTFFGGLKRASLEP